MPVHKTVTVDQELLNRAREILGTRTDAETVAEALDRIIFRDEVTRGIRAMAGSGSMRDIFDDDA